ncbi:MAG: chemotaxis protein CheC [Firmicutes bacterium]|nr:chemotaxis protein CheC [Bacillota bacterium]
MDVEQLMAIWQKASMPALAQAGLALKQFSGLDFDVTESDVAVVSWDTMSERFLRTFQNPLYAVHLRARGLFQAHILTVFSDVNGQRLVSALMGEAIDLPLDSMGLSALAEVGNVVGTAFLNVFADLFQTVWEPTTPRVWLTSAEELTREIAPGSRVLMSQALFQVTNEEVAAEIVVVPSLGGQAA